MTEQKVKNRGWVKNAVIIFLAVLLVLTFFSNTIMNRSLPEVSTQYTQSGTITAKIRGSGTVTANENYEVTLNQSREVLSVNVKTGDTVEVGDTLFVLKDKDSTELETAQDELDNLELTYQKGLINATNADYAKENRDIQLAKTALEEATEKLSGITYSDETISSLKQSIANQKLDVSAKKALLQSAEDALAELTLDPGSDNSDLYSAVQKAQAAVEAAKTELKSAELAYAADYKALEDQTKKNMEDYVKSLTYQNGQTYGEHLDSLSGDAATAFAAVIKAKAESEWKNSKDVYIAAEAKKLGENDAKKVAFEEVQGAKDAVSSAESAYNDARNAYNNAYNPGNSTEYNNRKKKVTEAQSNLDASTLKLENYEEQLETEETKKEDWDAANTEVKTAQVALEDLLFGLSEQQKTDGKTQAVEALDLAATKSDLDKAREEVAKLKTGSPDSTVLANVSGVIKSVGVSAGKTTEANQPLMVIEVADRGYYVSFPVTAEQSKRVKIGDSADVTTAYWGSSLNATLAGIKTDPDNPGTNKILVFEMSGEGLESGSQVSITLAQQSASYEMLIPNSALRTDSNGTYVLIVESKSTPLGNRYIAKRIDVTVLATDDTNSAISGGLSQWGDYVITNASKPIESGQQVRMVDN